MSAREALRQVIEGDEFGSLAELLDDLSDERAVQAPAGLTVSVARLVWHADMWNRFWVGRILGSEGPPEQDWIKPDQDDWETVRDEFKWTLSEAMRLATDSGLMTRTTKDAGTGEEAIYRIATHTAYHLGQIATVRQILDVWPPKGSRESWVEP